MKSTMAMDIDTLITELNRSAGDVYKNMRMFPPKYVVNTRGRKYLKITEDSTNGRVVCFIEKETGNIYKPAGWRGPYTKGNNPVRANVHDYESFMNKTDPYGGWLYV